MAVTSTTKDFLTNHLPCYRFLFLRESGISPIPTTALIVVGREKKRMLRVLRLRIGVTQRNQYGLIRNVLG